MSAKTKGKEPAIVDTSPLPQQGTADLPHYVSRAEFDLRSVEKLTPEQEKIYFASQLTLMWWKFRNHRVAVWCGVFLLALYSTVFISEFLSPWNYQTRHTQHIYVPPQGVHLFHKGEFIGPFVYDLKRKLNLDTMQREYSPDTTKPMKLSFFCNGDAYNWFGLIPGDNHLVCAPK
ncbi:MAG: ABC transporter permease, partial [Pseudomonadota bacterium]